MERETKKEASPFDAVITNKDVLPVPQSLKKWGAWDFSMVWLVMSVGVLTWEYPWFGIFLGLPWGVAVLMEFLGNVITLVPMIIQSHAGAKYGIAEPQVTRTRWGIWGAQFPSIVRAIIGTGWWGIQIFVLTEIVAGMYLYLTGRLDSVVLPLLKSGSANSYTISLADPSLFWTVFVIAVVAELALLYFSPIRKGQEALRKFSLVVAPLAVASLTAIFLYEGISHGWYLGSLPPAFGPFSWVSALSFLAANTANWLTMAISMPDLVRFAKSQRSQIYGQLALPISYAVFGVMGVMGTMFAYSSLHSTVIDPVLLSLLTLPAPLLAFVLVSLLLETFGVNTLANLLPPGYDLSNIYPKKLSWFKGVLIATVLGLAIGAWSFLGSAYSFVTNWLLAYGTALGIIVGINVADYAIIRRFSLNVEAVFVRKSEYWYWKGFNPAAFVTFAVLAVILYSPDLGIKVGPLEVLAEVGPVSGLFAIPLYLILMRTLGYWRRGKRGK
ncbi:MAG: cytosine permease [Candidatus Aramenus sp.]|jgi:NCS1 family nucleobase:cation symporter-1|nr:cytosine permease [Candidatus Aramenus sp.]